MDKGEAQKIKDPSQSRGHSPMKKKGEVSSGQVLIRMHLYRALLLSSSNVTTRVTKTSRKVFVDWSERECDARS